MVVARGRAALGGPRGVPPVGTGAVEGHMVGVVLFTTRPLACLLYRSSHGGGVTVGGAFRMAPYSSLLLSPGDRASATAAGAGATSAGPGSVAPRCVAV
jgi:hypothetical protein